MKKAFVAFCLCLFLVIGVLTPVGLAGTGFKDVKETDWYKPCLDRLVKSGYIDGKVEFIKPLEKITAAEFITYCVKIKFGVQKKKKTDKNDFDPYVRKALEAGLIKKNEYKSYTKTILKREAVKLLIPLLKNESYSDNMASYTLDIKDYGRINQNYREPLLKAYYLGIAELDKDGNIKPESEVARADEFVLLARSIDKSLRVRIPGKLISGMLKFNETEFVKNIIELGSGITAEPAEDVGIYHLKGTNIKIDKVKLPESVRKFTKVGFSYNFENKLALSDIYRDSLSKMEIAVYDKINGNATPMPLPFGVILYDDKNKPLAFCVIRRLGQLTLTDGKTNLDIINTSEMLRKAPELSDGLIIQYRGKKGMLIFLDRNKLPAKAKKTAYITTEGVDVWSLDMVYRALSRDNFRLNDPNQYNKYDALKGFNSYAYGNTLITLFDDQYNACGFCVVKYKDITGDIKLVSDDYNKDIGIPQFTEGADIIKEGNDFRVKIDREKLPESMRNFVNLGVTTTGDGFIDRDMIISCIEEGKGFTHEPYNEKDGFGVSGSLPCLMTLWDAAGNCIGFNVAQDYTK